MGGDDIRKLYSGAEELLRFEKGECLFVCGAGGKTTLIKLLAAYYRKLGRSVLITTTTHMLREEALCCDADSAIAALREGGWAFAGLPDQRNENKMTALPYAEFQRAAAAADLTLVEADGARHKKVKVPYPHEPVILKEAGRIAVIYSSEGFGRSIREAAYNPNGLVGCLREGVTGGLWQDISEDTLLTRELVTTAIERTYLKRLNNEWPQVPVSVIESRL